MLPKSSGIDVRGESRRGEAERTKKEVLPRLWRHRIENLLAERRAALTGLGFEHGQRRGDRNMMADQSSD